MRDRISREPPNARGFVCAIEGDWPDAARVDHYVRYAPPSEWTAFARFPIWMRRNWEVRALSTGCGRAMPVPRPRNVPRLRIDLTPVQLSQSVLGDLVQVDPAPPDRGSAGCRRWQGDPATTTAALTGSYRSCEEQVSVLRLRERRPTPCTTATLLVPCRAQLVNASATTASYHVHGPPKPARQAHVRDPDESAEHHGPHRGMSGPTPVCWRCWGHGNVEAASSTSASCAGTVDGAIQWIRHEQRHRGSGFGLGRANRCGPLWGTTSGRALPAKRCLAELRSGLRALGRLKAPLERAIGVDHPETELQSHYFRRAARTVR